jgi:DNA-binding response OmpR family regulator
VYASASILIFGHDATLLETRRLVLKSAGFRVWTAPEATLAIQILLEESIDLFVVCRSLSVEECEAILRTAHTLRPNMKNLVLSMNSSCTPADRRDTFLTSFLDPRSLISLIQNEVGAENNHPVTH